MGSWKPDPGLFLHVASALGVEPSRCAVVEDTAPGIDAGIAASMTVCRGCGCPVPRRTRSGREIVVPAGALDRHPSLMPQARIFFDSRAAWSCDDDVPRFSELPDWWR